MTRARPGAWLLQRPLTTPWAAVVVLGLIALATPACAGRSTPAAAAPQSAGAVSPDSAPATAADGSDGQAARDANAAPTRPSPPPGAAALPRLAPAAAPSASSPPHLDHLRRELDTLFAVPTLSTAVVGALVESLDTGETVYGLNPDTLVLPASNMKLVTVAVAGARLGWDFRYDTILQAAVEPSDGTLAGDLFVAGRGDPTFNPRDGQPVVTFREWAARLKAAGITHISGRIIGDDDAFEDAQFGEGWSWDDFAFGYSAPIGALQLNENVVDLEVRPGATPESPGTADITSFGGDIVVGDVKLTTFAPETPADITLERLPGSPVLSIRGGIAAGSPPRTLQTSVSNPTRYFVSTLRDVLQREGIAVDGSAVDIDNLPDHEVLRSAADRRHTLVHHQSVPLRDVARSLMKVSDNLYAEAVFRALSLRPGPASVEESRKVVDGTLRAWGLAPEQYVVADGSGLSRMNLLSARTLVTILRAMHRDPALSSDFEATLPIAGRDGTLAGRMKATRAEGNAVAKTGTMRGVRSLSGYLRTRDGETLAFAVLANNFVVPTAAVDAVVDRAVERLANFTR